MAIGFQVFEESGSELVEGLGWVGCVGFDDEEHEVPSEV